MKHHLILLISSLCLIAAIHAQDSVDRLGKEYKKLEHDGLARLHKRHYDKLIKVRDGALVRKNLPLANKAQSKLKSLKEQIRRLNSDIVFADEPKIKYPSNQFYRMTYHNGPKGTEHGREIICRFERVSNSILKDGTLVLTLSSDGSKYSNTPMDIFILNKSGGKIVGTLHGIRTGRTKKIPLTLTAAKKLEIAVVVKGHESLHLRPYAGSAPPELYLSIED